MVKKVLLVPETAYFQKGWQRVILYFKERKGMFLRKKRNLFYFKAKKRMEVFSFPP